MGMAAMQWSKEDVKVSTTPVDVPFVCPICWDHAIEQIEGIVLSAKSVGGRDLSRVSIYRCGHWHLFALFNQPME